MNKRARVSKFVFFGVLLLVILALSIVVFIVPAYSLVSGPLAFFLYGPLVFFYAPLVFFLYGGYQLFTGFKKMQKAKAQGEHVPWWKQPSIMSGSAYEGIAAIMLSIKLNPNWIFNVYFISAYVLMALLFVGLLMYGNNLMLQQAARRRDLSNPTKTNRKIRDEQTT